jgi:hypothetical protein
LLLHLSVLGSSSAERSRVLWDGRCQFKCDGTHAETKFRLSAKRSSLFKLTGASVQSTTGSRGVRIRSSNAGYTMFRGSVKDTGYPLYSPVSPSLPLPCVTMCHHISTGVYLVQTATELPAFSNGVVPSFALTTNPRRMEIYASTKSR